MPSSCPPTRGLVRLVRSALAHLYDEPYLQNHPLAFSVNGEGGIDEATRAQRLRGVLLDAVEQLKPSRQGGAAAGSARAYAILSYRYLEGLTAGEIADRLCLSPRQVYREHDKGVRAVACLLQDRLAGEQTAANPPPEAASVDLGQAAQAEVDRLRQAAQHEALDLREVLQNALQLIEPLTQPRGVQIQLDLPEGPLTVVADRIMLRQALMNLLSCGAYGAAETLQVSAALLADGIRLEVCADAGAATPAAPGAVNLQVAQALIQAQGGQLDLSLLGGEWRARLTLANPPQISVLVVDDNADLIALVRRYLGGQVVTVIGATDGSQALRLAAEAHPDVILLDVMMPSQDGWEVLQALKASPATSGVPTIVCSVLNQPQLARAMGATDYQTPQPRRSPAGSATVAGTASPGWVMVGSMACSVCRTSVSVKPAGRARRRSPER